MAVFHNSLALPDVLSGIVRLCRSVGGLLGPDLGDLGRGVPGGVLGFFGAGVSAEVSRFALASNISASSRGLAPASVLNVKIAAGKANCGDLDNCNSASDGKL